MAGMCRALCKSTYRPSCFYFNFCSVRNSYVNNWSNCNSQQLMKSLTVRYEGINIRYSHTFLSRVTADQLWKGVTSVSPAGRKKGRAKGARKRLQDLNRGQVIGFGKKNMLWPGLNAPIIRGREVVSQQELPPDDSREKRIFEMRDRRSAIKFKKLSPLERGWSGGKLGGRSLGPPDPVGEEKFEGFDSRVLEFRTTIKMSGVRGRIRTLNAFVVVGNKNGLAGFALAKSPNGNSALEGARNRASKYLRFIERYNNHTVLHDFHVTFGSVSIFVKKRPEGYGLVCHRALKSICEVIGIKDMYAKVEGAHGNMKNVTKAFFIGLMRQKLPEQIAEEKGLHLVELRKERDFFPVVIASPSRCRKEEDIDLHEVLDFNLYIHEGKVEAYRKPFEPFYINFPSHIKEMKDRERFRNHRDVKKHLVMRYGTLTSFLKVREEEQAKEKVKEAIQE